MNNNEVIVHLTEIFRKIFADDSLILKNELTASDIDNWDSLSHMLLITEVEEFFQIRFKLRELNKLKNVGVLIDIIDSKLT